MIAIRTTFDGERILLPDALRGLPPQEVVVVIAPSAGSEDLAWIKSQEASFAKVWENDEDSAYDAL